MSETVFALPKGYEDLAWLADWALPTERARHSKRIGTPLDQIQRVYDALLPRIEPAIAYLDQFPIKNLPPAEANLMLLTLVFVEVSPSVELLHSPTVPDGFEPSRFEVHF
ncbi:MAG: hypothetical protein AB7N69_05385 [Immundisolibacter sp.]|uniref:hypothetical protein n=1 Tax=Immundisolibacter sp. TaxID=1934948 RepID=UPI003D095D53